MYIPEHFKETRSEILTALMRDHPLGTIVISGSDGVSANHVPLILRPDAGVRGELHGHVSRGNALWREVGKGIDCLVIFHGREHYLSPNGYATKAEDGRVVPTWNYEVVHVGGHISAIDDPAWLRGLLDDLTRTHEASQSVPWNVGDAPADYVEKLIRGVVGLRISIESIVGKAKLSQNIPEANQRSAVRALRAAGDPHSAEMADAIESATNETD